MNPGIGPLKANHQYGLSRVIPWLIPLLPCCPFGFPSFFCLGGASFIEVGPLSKKALWFSFWFPEKSHCKKGYSQKRHRHTHTLPKNFLVFACMVMHLRPNYRDREQNKKLDNLLFPVCEPWS